MPKVKNKGIDLEAVNHPSPQGVNYLLAIAINEYEHHRKLSNCVRDAEELVNVLKEKYGFRSENTTMLFDSEATAANFVNSLVELSEKVTDQDNVVIFFSGHGYFDRSDRTGHLVPAEALNGAVWQYFSNADLVNRIRAINSFHTFLIVDSCFSGSLFARKDGDATLLAERVKLYPSRWALAAGQIEVVEDGLHGEHSPFADALLSYLKNNENPKSPVSDLIHYVRLATSRNANQTPIGGVLFKTGDMAGEFTFYLERGETSQQIQELSLTSEPSREIELIVEDEEVEEKKVSKAFFKQILVGAHESTTESMVLIKGGSFEMGDLFWDGYEDEVKHKIKLDDFFLSMYEVTFEEYDIFCISEGRKKPDDEGWGRGRRPVINISWYDAIAYCNWMSKKKGLEMAYSFNEIKRYMICNWSANGYRLPTEAEWEFAARNCGDKVRFGNGKDIADPMEINFDGNRPNKEVYSKEGKNRWKTTEVGSFSPNDLVLFDMTGNIFEWCWDWYNESFDEKQNSNPRGPSSGYRRVLKGGSWYSSPAVIRNSYRHQSVPEDVNNYTGFRLARSIRHF